MKTIDIECCKCEVDIFVDFDRDTPVGMVITCPHCGQAQSVEGGWIEVNDAPDYWGERINEDGQ